MRGNMNLESIMLLLANQGYNLAKNNNPQYLFFCKTNSTEFSAIILIDDVKYAPTTDPNVFCSIRDSLEKTFLLRGYSSVDILFVIFSKNPFAYKSLADSDFSFWISDVNNERIISYADTISSFESIRNDFERCMWEPVKEKSFISKVKEKGILSYPVFTIIFAAINIFVFLYMSIFGNLYDMSYLYSHGATEWHSVLENHEYYRLFTAIFIHFDFMHLFNNMISLIVIGSQLEPFMGHFKFLLTYILSGLAASLTSVLYYYNQGTNVISAGASGAIFGIFGGFAVYSLFDMLGKRHAPFKRIAIISLLMLYNGMSSQSVDNAAHLGGMIFGCIFAFICCICKKNKI